ncbi:MAG: hypothetical protein ACREBR_05555 [bacterium]
MVFYDQGIFYGSGAKYTGASSNAAQAIPLDLRFYRTSQDGVYVFWWGFDPAFITTSLISADFDLELDTDISFTSPNLVTFNKLTAITFQNGNVRKGFAVPVAARQNNIVQTWYARVRTHTPAIISDWSVILTWTIPMSVQQLDAERLMNSLPDFHVYGKGDLLKPLNQRNTNLWQVEYMYGNQLDQVYYINYLTQTNNFVSMAVDEVLVSNFGVLFNFPKPESMQYVDYRWILMNAYLASLVGGTNQAVILLGQAFTGVVPAINNIRDINNFILNTIQDPPIVPSGPQSTFYTSTPFLGGLVVEDLTTGMFVPSSNYIADPQQGSWMMLVPTNHTLQATFNIGTPIHVFNALSGATSLTGSVTFTNGSAHVTGSGTLFLSQLSVGNQITDSDGIYLGTIFAINSDTDAILGEIWNGPTETVTALKLLYTDVQLNIPILWDTNTLAWGIIITLFNPGNVPAAFLASAETLITQLLPAATKVYFLVIN